MYVLRASDAKGVSFSSPVKYECQSLRVKVTERLRRRRYQSHLAVAGGSRCCFLAATCSRASLDRIYLYD